MLGLWLILLMVLGVLLYIFNACFPENGDGKCCAWGATHKRLKKKMKPGELSATALLRGEDTELKSKQQLVCGYCGIEAGNGLAHTDCHITYSGKYHQKVQMEQSLKDQINNASGIVVEIPSLARKFNSDKPPMGLLSGIALKAVAHVLAFGAKKYSANEWRNGLKHVDVVEAALRHIFSYLDGEDNDPETGLPHLDHACCELMFACELIRTKPELDTRYKPSPPAVKTFEGKLVCENPTAMYNLTSVLKPPLGD